MYIIIIIINFNYYFFNLKKMNFQTTAFDFKQMKNFIAQNTRLRHFKKQDTHCILIQDRPAQRHEFKNIYWFSS